MAQYTPDSFLSFYHDQRASAILRTGHEDRAAAAMEAAIAGGFRVVEFTLTTPGAIDLVGSFCQRTDLPNDLAVGAGTVLTAEEASAAIDAGACFLVSPVVDESVISVATEAKVAMMAGTHTPTEMLRAFRAGSQLQKLFPAPGTGAEYVRACLGPMPFLRIVPTSGVDEHNVRDYFDAGAFAVGFVGTLFEPSAIASKDWQRITDRARTLLRAAPGES